MVQVQAIDSESTLREMVRVSDYWPNAIEEEGVTRKAYKEDDRMQAKYNFEEDVSSSSISHVLQK
jgi:hypothetical protein